MPTQFTTHTTLLARLAQGRDETAWREFQDRYRVLIVGFARRHGLQPSDCDEVVQDVLTSLCQAMPAFHYDPAKGKFRSYLKTVCLHAIYKRIRQSRRSMGIEIMEGHESELAEESDCEQAWEIEWRRYHLRRALSCVQMEFSKADLAAFDAYAVAGQGVRSTAQSLNMSVDQVYQAKSRILRRISELIEQQVQDEG